MARTELSPAEKAKLADYAETLVSRLPAARKVERFTVWGKSYRAVRVFAGYQVQSADGRRLIVERRTLPGASTCPPPASPPSSSACSPAIRSTSPAPIR
jgi:hypothetical protein